MVKKTNSGQNTGHRSQGKPQNSDKFADEYHFYLVGSSCPTNLNSLPNNKILAWIEFKAFADDNIDILFRCLDLSLMGRKHCGERRKMLVTTIFSKGFYLRIVWKRVNTFPNKPWFLRVCSTSLLKNTEGKGEIARNEQFLLFPQCFLPIWRTFCHFHQT